MSPFDRARSEWEQRARKAFYLIFVFLFDFLGGTRKTKCRVARVASLKARDPREGRRASPNGVKGPKMVKQPGALHSAA
jgi:hypothetical protein